MSSKIIGTGSALPKLQVTNQVLAHRLGLSEAAIEKRTGIRTRHVADGDETASGLATEAARAALQAAGLGAAAVDLLIVSTSSPELIFPSTACMVQRNLGLRGTPAFDLNASCSGFLYALSVADQYLRNESARTILVICVEVKSRFVNPDDPATAILFGDGAGAVVLSSSVIAQTGGVVAHGGGIRSVRIHADGACQHLAYLPGGGSRIPLTTETLRKGLHWMKMNGRGLFRAAVQTMDQALSDMPVGEVDLFIFHQANLRILEAVCKRRGIPPWKCHTTIHKFGNTSSASLPMALDDAVRNGKIASGNRIALCAFGGGITWGTALLDW